MSDRRSNNSWRNALREHNAISTDAKIREVVTFLARRAAERDFESLIQRQRRKKLKESRTKE